jgi:hypothetical protein
MPEVSRGSNGAEVVVVCHRGFGLGLLGLSTGLPTGHNRQRQGAGEQFESNSMTMGTPFHPRFSFPAVHFRQRNNFLTLSLLYDTAGVAFSCKEKEKNFSRL